MNDMTEFQQRAAAVAVMKMLNGKHFAITDLQAIAKTMGRESEMAGRDFDALRSLHCVDYADMGKELAAMVREKSCELLGLPPMVVENVRAEAAPNQPAHEPENRLRLAFWRKG